MRTTFTLKMLGCFNPILGKMWKTQPLGYIFNPMAGFVHILPKIGLQQVGIFLECKTGPNRTRELNQKN